MALPLVDLLKQQIDLADVIAHYGLAVPGDCLDAHPSEHHQCLHAYHAGGFLHCFSCGKNFDIIEIVKEKEGIGFLDAVRWLARQFHVTLPELHAADLAQIAASPRIATLQPYYEQLCAHYHDVLLTGTGSAVRQARAYLAERGYTAEQIAASELAFCPPHKEMRAYLAHTFPAQAALFTEFAGPPDKRRYVFKLNGSFGNGFRIMFPQRDRRGRITGLIKRATQAAGIPVNKHGKETLQRYDSVYLDSERKKDDLFGIHRLKPGYPVVVIVEAPLTVAVWGNDVPLLACGLGTVTEAHLDALRALHPRHIILAFDNDAPKFNEAQQTTLRVGTENTVTSLRRLYEAFPSIPLGVIPPTALGECKDPDAFCATRGVSAYARLIKDAQSDSAIAWLETYLLDRYGQTAQGQRERFTQIVAWAAALPPYEQDAWITKWIKGHGVARKLLLTELKRVQAAKRPAAAVALPTSATPTPPPPPVPDILIGSVTAVRMHVYDVVALADAAWEVIRAQNTPAKYFLHDNAPCYLVPRNGTMAIMPFTPKAFKALLVTCINWQVTNNEVPATCVPPADIVDHMLNAACVKAPPLPVLQRVMQTPYFTDARELHAAAGYDAAMQTYQTGACPVTVPDVPTTAQVQAAVELLFECVTDFPFVSDSDRAHALCLMLEPFIRTWFAITPLYDIESAREGTGKSLLLKSATMIFIGETPPMAVEQTEDYGWLQEITTKLKRSPSHVLFDNIMHPLLAAPVNAALTLSRWENRLLGGNDDGCYRNWATWAITANNPVFSAEIQRRCVRIRIELPTEGDVERQVKHEDNEAWILANRPALVSAALTLIRHYIVSGQPKPRVRKYFPSYEKWAEIMGGILEAAGVIGFLDNRAEFQKITTYDGIDLLVAAWWERIGATETTTRDVYQTLIAPTPYVGSTVPTPPPVEMYLKGRTEGQQIAHLNALLRRHRGRVFNLKPSGVPPFRVKLLYHAEQIEVAHWQLLALTPMEEITPPPAPVVAPVSERERDPDPDDWTRSY